MSRIMLDYCSVEQGTIVVKSLGGGGGGAMPVEYTFYTTMILP